MDKRPTNSTLGLVSEHYSLLFQVNILDEVLFILLTNLNKPGKLIHLCEVPFASLSHLTRHIFI